MSKSYPDTVPAEFTAEDTQDAYRRGWNHGHGIACHNVPKIGENYFTDGLGRVVVDAENIREVHLEFCQSAADNSRSYSPFEFTAHEFNQSGYGGFRLSTADHHDQDTESELWDTRKEAESAALESGYALIRDYVWEASGYFCQWSGPGHETRDHVATQVYATRQEAMNAANSVGCVAVVDEVSSSEELWEAFEQGTSDSISADLSEYTDDDYGLDNRPAFYECGICSHWHSADWNGDCREDDARFFSDQLDGKYGSEGWREVDMPA